MLLSEIVYNIKNLIAGGLESDDANLSDSQLAFIVGYYRAKLAKQDLDRGRINKEIHIQNLGKVNLIEADKNECCDTDGCILRTELKIPKPLETNTGLNITFVGTMNGRPFNKEYHNSMFWAGAAKYTGREPKWYYQNGYIYIVNPPSVMLDHINIQGIFEDPYVAKKFRSCDCPQNGEDCGDTFPSMDFEYPIPMHHIDTIVKLVSQTELQILMSFPNDISNDSIDQVSKILSNAGSK